MSPVSEMHISDVRKMEEEILHRPVDDEYRFYKAVQEGDVEEVIKNHNEGGFKDQSGKGVLSRNPLTNIKYHFVVTASLITRTCISGGMTNEEAYRLSDYYILRADNAKSIDEVVEIHFKMVMDFAKRMNRLRSKNAVSKSVHDSIEYIYKNIHTRITVEDVALAVNLSPSYLSRLFKKEIGLSLSDYIRMRKIDQAKNLLRFSDYTYVEISNYLAFVSQSHFIMVFKQYEGVTPKEYRERNYSATW